MKFKMEGTDFIRHLLAPHDYATRLDLENAFHHVKVSDSLLPYFGFAFLGRTFTYRGLPFGYRNSPYIFNKTLRIALKEIRKRWTVKVSNYIDDIILIHPNKEELKRITIGVI
jgi:hypothetical protein